MLTGLAHDEKSRIAYESEINQRSTAHRSRKLGALQKTLKSPQVFGEPEGDLLVVGWGSTRGAIEEAVERLKGEGARVSSLHLRFLSPMEPGLKDIFSHFGRVITIEVNYSDDPEALSGDGFSSRPAQLAFYLRAHTLVDVGCWSRVPGVPLSPGVIARELRRRLGMEQPE